MRPVDDDGFCTGCRQPVEACGCPDAGTPEDDGDEAGGEGVAFVVCTECQSHVLIEWESGWLDGLFDDTDDDAEEANVGFTCDWEPCLADFMAVVKRRRDAGTPATDEPTDDESSPRADAFGNEYPTDFDLAEQYYGKPGGKPATDESAAEDTWEAMSEARRMWVLNRGNAHEPRWLDAFEGGWNSCRDAHPAVAELARVRELGLDGVDREEDLKHRLRRMQAERDEARRRADVMQGLLARCVPLIMEVEGPGGTADPVVVQLLADIAAIDSYQHTVASTDQPHLSEVTTSTMPRSAPVASEGEGPLGDGGIEE
jgi:hypothetical protein